MMRRSVIPAILAFVVGMHACGDEVDDWIGMLGDPDPEVRERAFLGLRERGTSVVGRMREAIEDVGLSAEQHRQLEALLETYRPAYLLDPRHGPEGFRRAVRVFEEMGQEALDPLREAALGEDGGRAMWALAVLERLGPAAALVAPDLFALLAHPDRGRTAALALSALGAQSRLGLVDRLESREPTVRENAAHGLALAEDERCVPVFRALLADTDHRVRWIATNGLFRLGPRSVAALSELVALSEGDPTREVRCGAIAALGRLGSGEAIEPLLRLLSDEPVREVAVRALRELRAEEALPDLEALLAVGRDELGLTVAGALLELSPGHAKAESRLVGLLEHRSPRMRVGAALELAVARPGPHLAPALVEAVQGRDYGFLLRALSVLDGLSLDERWTVEVWLAALQSWNADARSAALSRLCRVFPPTAEVAHACLELLEDPVVSVRLDAIDSLALMNAYSSKIVTAMRKAAHHTNPRIAAKARDWFKWMGFELD